MSQYYFDFYNVTGFHFAKFSQSWKSNNDWIFGVCD